MGMGGHGHGHGHGPSMIKPQHPQQQHHHHPQQQQPPYRGHPSSSSSSSSSSSLSLQQPSSSSMSNQQGQLAHAARFAKAVESQMSSLLSQMYQDMGVTDPSQVVMTGVVVLCCYSVVIAGVNGTVVPPYEFDDIPPIIITYTYLPPAFFIYLSGHSSRPVSYHESYPLRPDEKHCRSHRQRRIRCDRGRCSRRSERRESNSHAV